MQVDFSNTAVNAVRILLLVLVRVSIFSLIFCKLCLAVVLLFRIFFSNYEFFLVKTV